MRCSFHRRKLLLLSAVLVLTFLSAYWSYRATSGLENGRDFDLLESEPTSVLPVLFSGRWEEKDGTSATSATAERNALQGRLVQYLLKLEHLVYPVDKTEPHVLIKSSRRSAERNIVLYRKHLEDIGSPVVSPVSGKNGWFVSFCFPLENGTSCLAKDGFALLKDYQRVSFIPGMDKVLLRNDGFCYTMIATRQISTSLLPPLSPPCHVLPGQRASLTDASNAKYLSWIKKPYGPAMTSGDGWGTAATFEDVRNLDGNFVIHALPVDLLKVADKTVVVQVYVLAMSVAPLRLYRHQEGVALVHPVKKGKPEVWALQKLNEHLTELLGEKKVKEGWQSLDAAIVKTLLIVEPSLLSHFHSLGKMYRCPHCFQLLTFICMFDSLLHPFVMEVKDSTQGDIPSNVVRDLVHLVLQKPSAASSLLNGLETFKDTIGIKKFGCHSWHKACLDEAHLRFLIRQMTENQHLGSFNKIYPTAHGEKYDALLSEMRSSGGGITSLGSHGDVGHTTPEVHAVLTALERYNSFKESGKGEATNPELFWAGTSSEDKTTKFGLDVDKHQLNCSDEAETKLVELHVQPAVLSPAFSSTTRSYQATVPFETMVITLWGKTSTCASEARINSLARPSKPLNSSVGVGWNQFQVLVVDLSKEAEQVVAVYKVAVFRQRRYENEQQFVENVDHQVCSHIQDCDLKVYPGAPCGLENMQQSSWKAFVQSHSNLPTCTNGHEKGRWVLPCDRCADSRSCYWRNAVWAPYSCQHHSLGRSELRTCMANKKVLFVGDSTNRGMMYYLMEKLNGSLKTWEKTHNMKVYSNQLNSTATSVSYAYYPQYWLPSNQKPGFVRALYQLIARFLPLENSNRTVLVVGGVQWLGSNHIRDTNIALKSLGLDNIKVIVKTSGAGFHLPLPGIKYNNLEEQQEVATRNDKLVRTVETFGYDAVDTFRITVSRYKEFLSGTCGCHFHKVIDRNSKLKEDDEVTSQWNSQSELLSSRYHVIGPINSVYSEILLGRLCG